MYLPSTLSTFIIRPTLWHLGLWSPAAEVLLLMTAATESHLGYWLDQISGPADGLYQMEPATARDTMQRVKRYLPLSIALNTFRQPKAPLHVQVAHDAVFSTALARVKYYLDPQPLPEAMDLEGLAHYYKRVWNTTAGKATVAQALRDYRRYVL